MELIYCQDNMKIKNHKAIFSTGRVKTAYSGIIGLAPDLTVTNGYDSGFYYHREDWMGDDYEEELTKSECIELADYMIAEWKRFKESVTKK